MERSRLPQRNEAGHGKYRHQFIDIFFADEFKQILWLRPGSKCPGIKKAHPDVFSYVYIAPFKPFIEQTAVGYDIGG